MEFPPFRTPPPPSPLVSRRSLVEEFLPIFVKRVTENCLGMHYSSARRDATRAGGATPRHCDTVTLRHCAGGASYAVLAEQYCFVSYTLGLLSKSLLKLAICYEYNDIKH